MNILVTGGLGFVGSNLVDRLVELGHDVYVIDNLSSESSSKNYMNDEVVYYIDDIRDIEHITTLPNLDVVYHLAGLARIQPSFSDPLEYIDVNITGTAKICELARNHDAKLIYSSSSSINNGKFKTPYTFSKWAGEEVLETWIKCFNINAHNCRFYNVYGPRDPETGEYATVVRKFMRQYKNNEPLTVVGDGEQRRDFTHVNDIVEGLIKISEYPGSGELFHLGCGVNYSINELVGMFDDPKVEYIPLRLGEGKATLADHTTTSKKLNWEAKNNLPEYIKGYFVKTI